MTFPGDSSGIICPLNDSRGRYFTRVVLLRLRGFLHALHLVEMTTVGTKRLYTLSPQQNSLKRILFHLLGKISSTKWISSVKDGFRCVALLRLRGSLDYARDDGTGSVVFYKEG